MINEEFKMKKRILTLASVACFAFASIPVAMAKHDQGQNMMRAYSHLDLSHEQKLAIKAILKTTREDNSLFAAEKASTRLQMQELMTSSSWDEEIARDTLSTKINQEKNTALNRAKASHQMYLLLSDDQKTQLNNLSANKEVSLGAKKHANANGNSGNKGAKAPHERGQGKLSMKRMAKLLELSETQITQMKLIDQASKASLNSFADSREAHRAQMQDVIQSTSFDEQAWLALFDEGVNDMLAQRLIKTKARYDKALLLSDEQREELTEIMKKKSRKSARFGAI
jgi:Spy/CpxP family protein refolding chaperone